VAASQAGDGDLSDGLGLEHDGSAWASLLASEPHLYGAWSVASHDRLLPLLDLFVLQRRLSPPGFGGIPVILTIAASSASCTRRHTGHPDHKIRKASRRRLFKIEI
jgi:hypothetical protein